MGLGMNSLFIVCVLASIYSSNGCTMEGVSVWALPIIVRIEDYHEGVFLQRAISNIGGYTLASSTDLNGGPYFSISTENSFFTLSTNDAYRQYEDNETAELVTLTFTFSCTAGTAPFNTLTVQIEINDNNNNPPLFKTPDIAASLDTTYEFTIAPPVPPGFLITNCISDIIVRDIDLTTYRIDFGINDNPYFEIAYEEGGSTVDKEFKAVLRTTSFIRSVPEPIVLTISATDVDRTGDPPVTTTTTVTIHGSSEFEMPLEPVFSQAFYLANYTEENQVTLEQPISLQQGYDDQVQFTLEGDYAEDHFAITVNGNLVILSVTNALPTEALQQGHIYLVVKAAREYTSGASATVVVQPPEVVDLEFERPHYEGVIVDNTLQLAQLILSQGYQGSTVTAAIEDLPSFFTASVVGNIITLSMAPLDDNIIQENSFINLRVTASADSRSATTIVTLEIVKDDIATPVFGESLYEGTYDSVAGLTISPILLVQGYDETVTVSLSGEHDSYFELVRDGASSTLRVTGGGLPSHILSETHLLLSVEVAKPRTVGATAVVSITLPGARELQFEAQSYKGSLQDNILTLDTIILNVGYGDDVTFSLSGDYSTSFDVSNVQNQVTITLPTQLPQEVISENNFLMLTLTASSTNAQPATTAVLLEIIKDDVTTPVFSQAIYYGTHLGSLDIDIVNMNLVQGYDDSVTFRIAGENSEYFDITQNQNSATLTVRSSIPEEVIFYEKVFVFNIFADKPLTVGANAAISIKFSEDLIQPTVMQFANNAYTGNLENNLLTVDSIVLETGFTEGTQFLLSGDFASYFTHTTANNIVSLSMTSDLPAEVLENNKFIVLELEARRERAVSAFTSIIIEIIEEEIVVPVFGQAYYTGMYTEENTLQFLETITLVQGYDETVIFGLEGESAAWFDVTQNGNSASIVSTSLVPQDILDSHHQLLFTVVAYKPNTTNGHAAISIDLPKDVLEQEVLRFNQSSYEGQLDGSELQIPTIALSNEITENVQVSLSGAYSTYFIVTLDTNIVQVDLTSDLPAEVISNNEFIVIDIIASKPDAISGYTALVLSIVKDPPITTPVFEQSYYTGEISQQGGLVFDHTIRLIQGYDESVSFTLDGDGSERFILTQTGQNSLSLSVAEGGMEQIENISPLVFTVVASKTGSITGEAAIVIHNTDVHQEQEVLRFDQSSYEGQLDGSELQIPTITLSNEITENVLVSLSGAYSTYFTVTLNTNIVQLYLTTDLPAEIISNNEFIVIDIIASRPDTRSGYTALVLSIVKEPTISTPVFEQAYYTGEISEQGELVFDHAIRLIQGYDESVSFTIDGDGSEMFILTPTGQNSLSLSVAEGGMEQIENISHLVFSVVASKTGSVSGEAAIVIYNTDMIELTVMQFGYNTYTGSLENNLLTLDSIVLETGFAEGTQFLLSGEFASYFTHTTANNIVSLSITNELPAEVLENNKFIVLELEARRERAVSAYTSIIIEIIEEGIVVPVFGQAYYTGIYTEENTLQFLETITLLQGYDETVTFGLEGESAVWFTVTQNGDSASIVSSSLVPQDILDNHSQLLFSVVANKPNTINAYAAISIDLPKDILEQEVLRFTQSSYEGQLDGAELLIPTISLSNQITQNVLVSLSGDYATYFTVTFDTNVVNLELTTDLPADVISENEFIVIDVIASKPDAVSGYTALVLSIVKESPISTPVFEQAYYTGEISDQGGLVFDHTIRLILGYDESVSFTLDGDGSEIFILTHTGQNSLTLSLAEGGMEQIENFTHLVFSVVASKTGSVSGETAIVIYNTDLIEPIVMQFGYNTYTGNLEHNLLTLDSIVLETGFAEGTQFLLSGDFASYFTHTAANNIVSLSIANELPAEVLENNKFIVLELEASRERVISAFTSIIIEILEERIVVPVFGQAYYTGIYTEENTLQFLETITLLQGYDETVTFGLEGESTVWFNVTQNGNSASIVSTSLVPQDILDNHNQLLFSVVAYKPNTINGYAAISIDLPKDILEQEVLRFTQSSYEGQLDGSELLIPTISLSNQITQNVLVSLSGDYATYFTVTFDTNVVNLELTTDLPADVISENEFVVIDVIASRPDAVSGYTALVLSIVKESPISTPVFEQAYYTGEISDQGGLVFDHTIRLILGYDESVSFTLDGDGSEIFSLTQIGQNSLTLSLAEGGMEQIENFTHLVFSIVASKTGSISGETAIVIYNTDLIEPTVMQFGYNTYTGNLEHNLLTLDSIVLETGFAEGTQFLLSGDFASYFTHTAANNIVSLSIANELPAEVLENNKFIVLELEASRERVVSAFTSIIIEILEERIVVPVFGQAYYTGIYTEENTLQFLETITLLQGYDETVTFGLEGESAVWFNVTQNGNSASIVSTSLVPQDIFDYHNQLLFSVVAYKPNTINGYAAISIDLPKDVLEQEVLSFTQSSFEGQLDGLELLIPTISLSNPITQNVLVSLSGDYATYFTVTFDMNVVNLELTTDLPAEVISENEFIVIDVIASRPDAVSGYTALVLSIVKDSPISTPVFEQTYYTGEISEQGGLVFNHTIRLIQGYDESVSFTLDGDGSEMFILTQTGQNSLSLSVAEGGMEQIENIDQLVFSVVASKTGSVSGAAAIVIHNTDTSTARSLRFSQNYYRGSLEENYLTVESISFVEGYSPYVELVLIGDYADYFQLVGQGGTYTLQLMTNIPAEIIEANNVLIFSLEANLEDTKTYATIILELIKNDNAEINALAFNEAYYIGTYSAATGNMPAINALIASGYDSDTVFTIEEGIGALFNVGHVNSMVTLTLVAPLPAELFINNQPVIFSLNAINSVGSTASTTIVVTLEDELSELTVLGFESNNYLGTIDNGTLTLQPITLNQGYSPEVHFTLQGDLASYFTLVQQDSTVNIVLHSDIPEQSISNNNVIVIELQATAVQAISASATIVFDVVKEEFAELVFSAPYYVGQYHAMEGLEFDNVISLDVGYDENVEFLLEGEHAQWFVLHIQGNSVTLTLASAIPPAIIINNHQLVFSVFAQKPNSNIARAAIVISLVEDFNDVVILGFERSSYLGHINDDELSLDPIVLNEGYAQDVSFTLHGELSSYFSLQWQNNIVNIMLQNAIPEQILLSNSLVILEVQASAPEAITATTTVVIKMQQTIAGEELVFSAAHYIGQFSETNGLDFDTVISLTEGFDEHVEFSLDGEHSQWFALQGQDNTIIITLSGAIPPAILVNNHQLVFSVIAQKPNSNIARAIVVISLVEDYTDAVVLGFERSSYLGAITNDVLSIEPIILNEGYSHNITFTLHGELAIYFTLLQQDSTVNMVLQNVIPEQVLPANSIVMLELRASAPRAIPATTAVVIEAERAVAGEEIVFSLTHYIGEYSETNGFEFNAVISLVEGFDQHVEFSLEGEHAQWFALQGQDNSITITLSGAIPPAILVNNHQLVFSVTAQKPNSNIARAIVIISLVEDYTGAIVLGFERSSYLASITNDVLSIESIVLNEGYSDAVTFTLHGELSSYFNLQQQDFTVNIMLEIAIPEQALPSNGIVTLEVRASARQAIPATTTVIIDAQRSTAEQALSFSEAYYTGEYSETGGLEFDNAMSLDVGYDQDVDFTLEGDYSQYFSLSHVGNTITLIEVVPVPPTLLIDLRKIIMTVSAIKPSHNIARTIVVLSIINNSGSLPNETFDKVLYEGTINLNVVQHEPITITGFTGSDIEILGVYRDLFSAAVSERTVLVSASGTLGLPEGTTHVALELRAGGASAVLILDVIQTETPELPTITFGSPSYVLRADMTQTGLVGQVQATASNGETIAYSLAVDNAHLQERVSINGNGEIHLSAPTTTGVYNFQVIATSAITQVQATATVQLTVEAAAPCGDDHTLPPLIILDRDEEEPHANLVVLDSVAQEGCQFRLTNRWPLDQDWLYVDDSGLHARSIDREDPRIAFMALSQVQVELVLECATDAQSRVKRSDTTPWLDWLGPYEYGSNKWILTDTILYNSRRSFVNLIVNDINDNYPIFVGKENEPLVCGYPVPELEGIILPRALAELKATDADVGENAALAFWSPADELAVSPTTGSVHVRDGASLTHDQLLTVSATDLNGREDGLTGSIQLLVKLVDTSNIAVVTVRNAFLDQEETILSNLSSAVGYEVKVLSSAVISDDPADSQNARSKREATGQGASLQLYVYGVIDREPVAVDRLTNDITEHESAGVDVTSTVSLEDYLEGREINGGSGRDTGLLVATIVLSVLLFILIVAIAVWFFLRWRKARNYEQFSDANSLASRAEPLEEPPKLDTLNKPRLNIDELKRSERRLQEMLDAPIGSKSNAPKAQTSQADPEEAFDTIINIAPTDTTLPIVIQSIDKLKDDASGDEDEFGEKTKDRRKSVVTFNENVERIIHVEDIPDDNSSDVEIFKF